MKSGLSKKCKKPLDKSPKMCYNSTIKGKELTFLKIDHRRHYVLVIDTETANTIDNDGVLDMSNVLVYDCGWAVVDTKGNVYLERSFVNTDIFQCYDLMNSAYYAQKIPIYLADLAYGTRIPATTYEIRKQMLADIADFGITEVVAHNARFDVNALNSTLRWQTKSKFRNWLPFGIEVWDTMKMARSVIHKMPTYRKFCEKHGLMTANGRLSTTAENLYKFISNNVEFSESHTGLEDVRIEREIMWHCFRQHKPMEKVLYARSDTLPPTELQKKIMFLIKNP